MGLMPGRPEINELFVGYTHSLRPYTPRPPVSKQLYWVSSLSTEAKSSLPEYLGETLFFHFLSFAPLHLDENVLAPYVAFIFLGQDSHAFKIDTQRGENKESHSWFVKSLKKNM